MGLICVYFYIGLLHRLLFIFQLRVLLDDKEYAKRSTSISLEIEETPSLVPRLSVDDSIIGKYKVICSFTF